MQEGWRNEYFHLFPCFYSLHFPSCSLCLNSLGLQSLYSNLWIENISIFVGGEVLVQMYEQGRGPQDLTTFMQALTCFPSLAVDSPCLHHHACWLQSLRLSGNMWLELSFLSQVLPCAGSWCLFFSGMLNPFIYFHYLLTVFIHCCLLFYRINLFAFTGLYIHFLLFSR